MNDWIDIKRIQEEGLSRKEAQRVKENDLLSTQRKIERQKMRATISNVRFLNHRSIALRFYDEILKDVHRDALVGDWKWINTSCVKFFVRVKSTHYVEDNIFDTFYYTIHSGIEISVHDNGMVSIAHGWIRKGAAGTEEFQPYSSKPVTLNRPSPEQYTKVFKEVAFKALQYGYPDIYGSPPPPPPPEEQSPPSLVTRFLRWISS